MKTTLTRPAMGLGAALAAALAVAACDTNTLPTEASMAVVTEDAALEAILYAALQDEYHAESVYQGVLADFGQVTPFSNIINAEVRHSAAIGQLYTNRGWTAPASIWTVDNVPRFSSVAEACSVGVDAEIANVEVYDELMEDVTLPSDVVQVFNANRAASLERHLPAFQRCAG